MGTSAFVTRRGAMPVLGLTITSVGSPEIDAFSVVSTIIITR